MSKERHLVFDEETTGFSFRGGDRVISYGGVMIVDGVIKPKQDLYLEFNPSPARSNAGAEAAHGLTHKYLCKQPVFADNCKKLIKQIKKADYLVAHNASFDWNFLHKELSLIDMEHILDNVELIDTAQMARKRLEGRKFNLDHCCKVLGIENNRTTHNALEDAQITARLYLKLLEMEANDTYISGYDGDGELEDSGRVELPSEKERKRIRQLIGA